MLSVALCVLISGVVVTAATPLAVVIAGIAMVTVGFFGAHTIVSTWVGRRGGGNRGKASAIYLSCCYAGASLLGTAGGSAWTYGRWRGVTVFCLGLGTLAALGATALAKAASRLNLETTLN